MSTKVILVMGHAGCAVVKATIQGKEVPGQISALYPHTHDELIARDGVYAELYRIQFDAVQAAPVCA